MQSIIMEPDMKKLVMAWAKKNGVANFEGRLTDDLYDVAKREPKN